MLASASRATYGLRYTVTKESRMRVPVLFATLLTLAAGTCATPAAQAADLASHRALYNLTLGTTKGEDVTAATGTMSYEVTDACDAWAVRQRLDMTVTNQQGQAVKMISDYATWESKDGLKMRFHMRQTTDDAVTEQVDGDAHLDKQGGPGQVHYTTPADATKPLPAGTYFPMAHTGAIIDAAAAGKKFLAVPLFDGTGEDGAQDTFITITGWQKPGEATSPSPELDKLASGRVHVAFFARKDNVTNPEYEVAMRYWANGVANGLVMNFGDFSMNGALDKFTLLPGHC